MSYAIFLDRDGTLIPSDVDKPLTDVKDFCLLPGVVPGLMWMQNQGYKLIIISNQSGIADGRWSKKSVIEICNQLEMELSSHGILLNDFYICPHGKEAGCNCRKPKTGLIESAVSEHGINLNKSYMIGNELKDVQTGKNAECTTILVGDSYKNRRQFDVKPDFQAETLEDAVKMGCIRSLR